MKQTFFLICLLGTLCALSFATYYRSPDANSLPCTTREMIDLTNKARNNITWIMALINDAYPRSRYPQSPLTTDKNKALYYVQQARLNLTNTTWPNFTTLESHDALNIPAGMHAHQMATYDYFSHSGCCNGDPFKRMGRYASWKGMAENLWMSYAFEGFASWTCEEVLVDLIVDINVPSFGHRKNTYSNSYTHIGVGFGGTLAGAWETYYVSFNFGKNPTNINTALITANANWLNHYVQGVVCPEGQTFSGQSGTTIKRTCTITTTSTTTTATTSTSATSTTSSSTSTTSKTPSTPTTSTSSSTTSKTSTISTGTPTTSSTSRTSTSTLSTTRGTTTTSSSATTTSTRAI